MIIQQKLLFSYSKLYACMLMCLLTSNASAQELKTTRDIGVWFNLGLNYKFAKDWDVSLTPSLRTYDNALELKNALVDLELDYKINKNFKLGAGIRYDYARRNDLTFTHDIRYNFDFEFQAMFSEKLKFEYRFRYQHKYINLFTFNPETKENSFARNRVKFEYGLVKSKLYFSAEIFRKYEYYVNPQFNSIRLSLGDEFKTSIGEIDLALAYERELNDLYPLNFIFLNLSYKFKFENV